MKARTTMKNLLWVGWISFAAAGAAAQTPTTRPATVEEAARVLDLASFPLLAGAETPKTRRLANLSYEAKSSVAVAFAFQKKVLTGRGWIEQEGGYVSDQASSATFFKDGYRVSVSVFPSKPGSVSVMLTNHGNIDTKAIPVPADAKLLYGGPVSTMFRAEQAVAPTAEECRKLLTAQGWQPYGTAGDSQFFKQNAVRLNVRVLAAPAQGNKTVIDLSSELLSADLPAPADTVRASYADITKEVSFDTKARAEEIVKFYREVLGKAGWKATTEAPLKMDFRDVLFFRNPAKDFLQLTMHSVDGILRVSLRHYSEAEWAELERLANAERKPKPPAPSKKPTVVITLPAAAKEVQISEDECEFKLDRGTSRAAVIALRDELVKAGWKEFITNLEPLGGAVSLASKESLLTIVYADFGLEPAEVTISTIGVTIELSKKK